MAPNMFAVKAGTLCRCNLRRLWEILGDFGKTGRKKTYCNLRRFKATLGNSEPTLVHFSDMNLNLPSVSIYLENDELNLYQYTNLY